MFEGVQVTVLSVAVPVEWGVLDVLGRTEQV